MVQCSYAYVGIPKKTTAAANTTKMKVSGLPINNHSPFRPNLRIPNTTNRNPHQEHYCAEHYAVMVDAKRRDGTTSSSEH